METGAWMKIAEGVTRYSRTHTTSALKTEHQRAIAAELASWRKLLKQVDLIGQNPQRYDGAGFGNLSGRLHPISGPRGQRTFLITGTQTGQNRCMTNQDFAVVKSYDWNLNRVHSMGPTKPSSEAMTHGAIYDLGCHIRFVFHVHSPDIWNNYESLSLPFTSPNIEYGTPAMASEIGRLAQTGALLQAKILVMGGHEDGVISFGRTAQEAGGTLLQALSNAYAGSYRRTFALCDD